MDKNSYKVLMSRLRNHHYDYFKKSLGLNLLITFDGYDTPVNASIPYKNNPIEFYKWICDNPDEVILSFREKVELVNKVYLLKPSALKSIHRKKIEKTN
jgi:hypothetical protein